MNGWVSVILKSVLTPAAIIVGLTYAVLRVTFA